MDSDNNKVVVHNLVAKFDIINRNVQTSTLDHQNQVPNVQNCQRVIQESEELGQNSGFYNSNVNNSSIVQQQEANPNFSINVKANYSRAIHERYTTELIPITEQSNNQPQPQLNRMSSVDFFYRLLVCVIMIATCISAIINMLSLIYLIRSLDSDSDSDVLFAENDQINHQELDNRNDWPMSILNPIFFDVSLAFKSLMPTKEMKKDQQQATTKGTLKIYPQELFLRTLKNGEQEAIESKDKSKLYFELNDSSGRNSLSIQNDAQDPNLVVVDVSANHFVIAKPIGGKSEREGNDDEFEQKTNKHNYFNEHQTIFLDNSLYKQRPTQHVASDIDRNGFTRSQMDDRMCKQNDESEEILLEAKEQFVKLNALDEKVEVYQEHNLSSSSSSSSSKVITVEQELQCQSLHGSDNANFHIESRRGGCSFTSQDSQTLVSKAGQINLNADGPISFDSNTVTLDTSEIFIGNSVPFYDEKLLRQFESKYLEEEKNRLDLRKIPNAHEMPPIRAFELWALNGLIVAV